MCKIIILDSKEEFETLIQYTMEKVYATDLVAYRTKRKDTTTYFIVKSRFTRNNIEVSAKELSRIIENGTKSFNLKSFDDLEELIPKNMLRNSFKNLDVSRPYLFSILDRNGEVNTDITVLFRSFTLLDNKRVRLEYLMDSQDKFEKFLASNRIFYICILDRTGQPTKKIEINIKDQTKGLPIKLSQDADPSILIFRKEIVLE